MIAGRWYDHGEATSPTASGGRAFNGYLALMVFHDFMNDGQPQTGALFPCGKKRLEYFFLLLLSADCGCPGDTLDPYRIMA